MTVPQLRVAKLGPETVADFHRVHDQAGCGGCHCVAWWVPTWEEWGERTPEMNRALRVELFGRGQHDGYLLYDGAIPIGWCQTGPRDRLAKISRMFGFAPEPEVQAITCFLLLPSWRGAGVGSRLLAMVVDDLRRAGSRRIQAFPDESTGASAEEIWCGTMGMFAREGFRPLRTPAGRTCMEWRADAPMPAPL